MSDDSDWRYSVDDVENLQTHTSNPIANAIGVIGVAGFLFLVLYGVTAQPATTTPNIEITSTETGSQITIKTLPYRYTQLTVNTTNTTNTTHTVRNPQTITINDTSPRNITVTGYKRVYNGFYAVTTEKQPIHPQQNTTQHRTSD